MYRNDNVTLGVSVEVVGSALLVQHALASLFERSFVRCVYVIPLGTPMVTPWL